jgi:hypothetical protein
VVDATVEEVTKVDAGAVETGAALVAGSSAPEAGGSVAALVAVLSPSPNDAAMSITATAD